MDEEIERDCVGMQLDLVLCYYSGCAAVVWETPRL